MARSHVPLNMSLQVGQQLVSHAVSSLLGKGGMGEVYRARDSNLKPDVAINKPNYAVRHGRFLIDQVVEESTISPITLVLNWNPDRKK